MAKPRTGSRLWLCSHGEWASGDACGQNCGHAGQGFAALCSVTLSFSLTSFPVNFSGALVHTGASGTCLS